MIATSPIDPMRVFLHAAKLLGANEGYDFHINEHRINAKLGQGLPALYGSPTTRANCSRPVSTGPTTRGQTSGRS